MTWRKISRGCSLALAMATAAAAQPPVCPCDCDSDGRVGVGELVTAVAIALGNTEASSCPAADIDSDDRVAINELIAGVQAALHGCSGEAPTPTAIPSPTHTPSSEVPPLGDAALLEWLRAGSYLGWRSEPEQHDSAGPHFGDVRTFINDTLSSSLEIIPPAPLRQGSAAVKELFGGSGNEVRGWAVMIKVEEESDGGNGWYWYERFGNSVFADGRGVRGCTGCHSTSTMTHVSRDFFLSSVSFRIRSCQHNDEPLDVCADLATPGQSCEYDGNLRYNDGPVSAASLNFRSGQVLLEGWIYWPSSQPSGSKYEGEFFRRHCAGDFPKPVNGSLELSNNGDDIEFILHREDGEGVDRFTGQRRR